MFAVREFGTCLTSRASGEKVRLLIKEELSNTNNVAIDFKGVEVASHSFCDEAFGKLICEIGFENFKRRLKFWNCSEEIKAVIRFVLRERVKTEKELCLAR